MNYQYHALASHSQQDARDSVGLITQSLKEKNIKIWWDMDQKVSMDGMLKGIENSKTILVFLTKTYFTRQWCRWELFCALVMEKPVIFVHENRFEKAFSFNPKVYLQGVPKDWHEIVQTLVKETVSIEYETVGHQREAMMEEITQTIENPESRG